jgi:nitrogen regulatory protein PII
MEDNIKKIEIVTDMAYLKKITSLIDDHGNYGYTIIKDISGKGGRGHKDGHGVSSGFKNCYFFMFCEEIDAKKIIELLKPYLKKFGGICTVSDSHWVYH